MPAVLGLYDQNIDGYDTIVAQPDSRVRKLILP